VSKVRDLLRDLELCENATRGPWIALPAMCGPDGMEVYQEESMGCICIAGDPCPRGENRPTANMHFIAEAREGWPHAIDRAIASEARTQKLEWIRETLINQLIAAGVCPTEDKCPPMMKTIVLSGRPACVVCWLYHADEWYEAETREGDNHA
jgi:hypothetical protein